MAYANRLRFVHRDKIYDTREALFRDVKDNPYYAVNEYPAMYAEPMIFRYGSEENPNIVLAIGSVGNGVEKDESNKIFFIDIAHIQEEIEGIQLNAEEISKLDNTLRALITACGVSEEGEYEVDSENELLKSAVSLFSADQVLANAIIKNKADLEKAIEELHDMHHLKVQSTDSITLTLNEDNVDEGRTLVAEVNVPKLHRFGDTTNTLNQILVVEKEDASGNEAGLFYNLTIDHNEGTNTLSFIINNETVKEVELQSIKLINSIEYSKEEEKIYIHYTNAQGVNDSVEMDVNDIFTEYKEYNDNKTATVSIDRNEGEGVDGDRSKSTLISVDVNVADERACILNAIENNILKVTEEASNGKKHLYVDGVSTNIKHNDTTVGEAISTIETSISDEIKRAIAAENQLSQSIETEIETRENADATLQDNIEAEETRAIEAETALGVQVSKETSRAELIESNIATTLGHNENGTYNVYNPLDNEELKFLVDNNYISNVSIREDILQLAKTMHGHIGDGEGSVNQLRSDLDELSEKTNKHIEEFENLVSTVGANEDGTAKRYQVEEEPYKVKGEELRADILTLSQALKNTDENLENATARVTSVETGLENVTADLQNEVDRATEKEEELSTRLDALETNDSDNSNKISNLINGLGFGEDGSFEKYGASDPAFINGSNIKDIILSIAKEVEGIGNDSQITIETSGEPHRLPEENIAYTYTIKQGDVEIDTIRIPKDSFLQEASIEDNSVLVLKVLTANGSEKELRVNFNTVINDARFGDGLKTDTETGVVNVVLSQKDDSKDYLYFDSETNSGHKTIKFNGKKLAEDIDASYTKHQEEVNEKFTEVNEGIQGLETRVGKNEGNIDSSKGIISNLLRELGANEDGSITPYETQEVTYLKNDAPIREDLIALDNAITNGLSLSEVSVVKKDDIASTSFAEYYISQNGSQKGATIVIPKDKHLKNVELGNNKQSLTFTFNLADGTESATTIDFTEMIINSEVDQTKGLSVNDGIISINLSSDGDTNKYLSFGEGGGLKLSGITKDIEDAKDEVNSQNKVALSQVQPSDEETAVEYELKQGEQTVGKIQIPKDKFEVIEGISLSEDKTQLVFKFTNAEGLAQEQRIDLKDLHLKVGDGLDTTDVGTIKVLLSDGDSKEYLHFVNTVGETTNNAVVFDVAKLNETIKTAVDDAKLELEGKISDTNTNVENAKVSVVVTPKDELNEATYEIKQGDNSLATIIVPRDKFEECGNGIVANDKKIGINIKPDEKYLKLSDSGTFLTTNGIDTAISDAVSEVNADVTANTRAIETISDQVDTLKATVGNETNGIVHDVNELTNKANALEKQRVDCEDGSISITRTDEKTNLSVTQYRLQKGGGGLGVKETYQLVDINGAPINDSTVINIYEDVNNWWKLESATFDKAAKRISITEKNENGENPNIIFVELASLTNESEVKALIKEANNGISGATETLLNNLESKVNANTQNISTNTESIGKINEDLNGVKGKIEGLEGDVKAAKTVVEAKNDGYVKVNVSKQPDGHDFVQISEGNIMSDVDSKISKATLSTTEAYQEAIKEAKSSIIGTEDNRSLDTIKGVYKTLDERITQGKYEGKNPINISGTEISLLIDPESEYVTLSDNGLKVSGIQEAIEGVKSSVNALPKYTFTDDGATTKVQKDGDVVSYAVKISSNESNLLSATQDGLSVNVILDYDDTTNTLIFNGKQIHLSGVSVLQRMYVSDGKLILEYSQANTNTVESVEILLTDLFKAIEADNKNSSPITISVTNGSTLSADAKVKVGTDNLLVVDGGELVVYKESVSTVATEIATSKINELNIQEIRDNATLLKSTVEQLNRDLTSTTNKVSETSSDVANIKIDVATIKGDMDTVKTRLEKDEERLDAIEAKNEAQSTDISWLKEGLATANSTVSALSDRVTRVEITVGAFETRISNLESQLNKVDELSQKIDALERSLNEKIDKMQEFLDELFDDGTFSITPTV